MGRGSSQLASVNCFLSCAHNNNNRYENEEKELEIEIEPGMRDGYQYPFIAEGKKA